VRAEVSTLDRGRLERRADGSGAQCGSGGHRHYPSRAPKYHHGLSSRQARGTPDDRRFSTTDLDRQLRERDVSTLILAGLSTSGVVLSTVRDAADRDYELFVLADACADPQPGVHEFLTERIFPRQANVIAVADLEGLLASSQAEV
jgi:hypothetical protein